MRDEIQKLVTPEYLLAHGFFEYRSEEEGDCCDIPFEENQNCRHFREIEFHRQLFVVIFWPFNGDASEGFSVDMFVQKNAGCGFIEIPFPWYELPIEYFESVYFGIRGEKPKQTANDKETN